MLKKWIVLKQRIKEPYNFPQWRTEIFGEEIKANDLDFKSEVSLNTMAWSLHETWVLDLSFDQMCVVTCFTEKKRVDVDCKWVLTSRFRSCQVLLKLLWLLKYKRNLGSLPTVPMVIILNVVTKKNISRNSVVPAHKLLPAITGTIWKACYLLLIFLSSKQYKHGLLKCSSVKEGLR